MLRVHFLKSLESISVLPRQHPAFKIDAAVSPYAGCPVSCAYCPCGDPAKTGVKTDLPHLLEERLRKETRRLHVGIGTACEPYGPAEKEFKLTRSVIEVLLSRMMPLQIFTKSPLILQDMPLLKEYSRMGQLAVSVSLFTLDPGLSALFEPGAEPPLRRLTLLRTLRNNDVFAGVVLAPIMPYLSDSPEQLDEIFARVRKAGGEYIVPQVLCIENAQVRRNIRSIFTERYPKLLHRLDYLYETKKQPSLTYAMRIRDTLRQFSGKYNIPLYLPVEGGSMECASVCQAMVL